MTQQFLQLFTFHRFRQTVGHKAFQTRFFPVKKARKEKLTFRLYFQGKKIIFRTRAIWVGIFWHGTHQQKMEWKKQKTFDTPQTISFFQLYIQVVCKVLYLSKKSLEAIAIERLQCTKASVCISSNFMFLHILKFASVHCFCLRITMFFTGWSSKDDNPVGQPHC